jgi:pyruvate dehydrogenase E2 component (dihydrolipoamide acetyltransferase)
MAHDVTMPRLGPDMDEGTLVEWMTSVGDSVAEGDVIALIETDKSEVELTARVSGVITSLDAVPGDAVPVGTPIAIIDDGSPAASDQVTDALHEVPAPPTRSGRTVPPPPAPADRSAIEAATPGSSQLSPLIRRMLETNGLQRSDVTGTGPGGRITREDVERHLASSASTEPTAAPTGHTPRAGTRQGLSRAQVAAARRLAMAKATIPEFAVTRVMPVDRALDLVAEMRAQGHRCTFNDVVIRAVARALVAHPDLNSSFDDDAILLHPTIDVSMAIATPSGILTPVIPTTNRLALRALAEATAALVERGRAGRLRPDDLAAGTITISNLGMFGATRFVPIINPPHVAIVGVGAVEPRIVPRPTAFDVVKAVELTVVADHRAVDGVAVARFLADVDLALQEPDG